MAEVLFRDNDIVIARDEHGVPCVDGPDERAMYWGMGWVHGTDRAMQMLLMRILGRGELSLLDGSDGNLAVDTFFRRMNWSGGAAEQAYGLSDRARRMIGAYCQGVNAALSRRIPWELRVAGYRHRPWTASDSVVLNRMTGYLTLAQSQGEIERLLVEMAQAGVSRDKLEELFPGQLEGLDETILLVKLGERLVPAELFGLPGAPRAMASNNWVVAGTKTASGKPILANDPHLEVNRLPNVWCEIALRTPVRWAVGVTMPGLPGVLIGRNPDLAWGATYTFMDGTDSWMERCKEGRYERAGAWERFRERREIIARRGRSPTTVTFHENDHGVLDGDPHVAGVYLATRWSSACAGARSLNAICDMWSAASVEEGQRILGSIETAWNWVLADRQGSIGYQMSGLMPLRRDGVSGLVPLPGWDPENDWRGFADAVDLPRAIHPEQGFFVTANNDLNPWGKRKPINAPMGSYRAERIAMLLENRDRLTSDDMRRMQMDLYSLQAERFMDILNPLLPDTAQGKILARWDRCYGPDSEGAWLFEQWYRALFVHVFGKSGVGVAFAEHVRNETGIFADFYATFDRVLLKERSAWFGSRGRDEVYRDTAAAALDVPIQRWGDVQKLTLKHLILGGKLPMWAGFDHGPVVLPGGRATIHQGQIYRSGGRDTSFAPSVRLVMDLADAHIQTALIGGPSERRFSRWYLSGLEGWQRGELKRLGPR